MMHGNRQGRHPSSGAATRAAVAGSRSFDLIDDVQVALASVHTVVQQLFVHLQPAYYPDDAMPEAKSVTYL